LPMYVNAIFWDENDQEASLTVGLGKPPANRNRVGLCELLRLCTFLFSSTLAHSSGSQR
jgi:hypothetical protein